MLVEDKIELVAGVGFQRVVINILAQNFMPKFKVVQGFATIEGLILTIHYYIIMVKSHKQIPA